MSENLQLFLIGICAWVVFFTVVILIHITDNFITEVYKGYLLKRYPIPPHTFSSPNADLVFKKIKKMNAILDYIDNFMMTIIGVITFIVDVTVFSLIK